MLPRASNFYIGLYWSEFMAMVDPSYQPLATQLCAHRQQVVTELMTCQGRAVDLGGYYLPDPAKVQRAMRPSPTLNAILEEFSGHSG